MAIAITNSDFDVNYRPKENHYGNDYYYNYNGHNSQFIDDYNDYNFMEEPSQCDSFVARYNIATGITKYQDSKRFNSEKLKTRRVNCSDIKQTTLKDSQLILED